MALAMQASRAGDGLSPISASFRAARIVAEKRIAYFRCSSMESSRAGFECGQGSVLFGGTTMVPAPLEAIQKGHPCFAGSRGLGFVAKLVLKAPSPRGGFVAR